MKKVVLLPLLSLFLISCSRKVIVRFDRADPEKVASKNFDYNHNTVCVKTANQNVVYSANELSSRINIIINTIEREFKLADIKTVKESAKPDMVIELIGIEPLEYHTNRTEKPNGNTKVIPCDVEVAGAKIYIKIIDKNNNSVDYTFFHAPCRNGCIIDDYGYFCDGKVKKGKVKEVKDYGYIKEEFPTEAIGRYIAKRILKELNEN